MSLGQWLNSLSTMDHLILLILFIISCYLSNQTLKNLIELYDKKTGYSKFRIKFRVTPAALLSLGLFYSIIIYQIIDGLFGFMP
jgi:hypothetical protein